MNNKEIQEQFEQLASTIYWIKTKLVDLQEEKGLAPVKKPYEVKVLEDLENYFYVDETGIIYKLSVYVKAEQIKILNRGLAFKTREEAERYDKERILLFKMHKRAEEHNGDWVPNWNDFTKKKHSIVYDHDFEKFYTHSNFYNVYLSKLPLFKSEEIAEQFIKEFGDEIKEVLC